MDYFIYKSYITHNQKLQMMKDQHTDRKKKPGYLEHPCVIHP